MEPKAPELPGWAEQTLERFGPQRAFGSTAARPASLQAYAQLTERFRTRWRTSLQPEVFSLFESRAGRLEHGTQAETLLAAMIGLARDLARGPKSELRAELARLQTLDDQVREGLAGLVATLQERETLQLASDVDSGLDLDLFESFSQLLRYGEFAPFKGETGLDWTHLVTGWENHARTTSRRRPELVDLLELMLSASGTAAQLRYARDVKATQTRKAKNQAANVVLVEIDDLQRRGSLLPAVLKDEAIAAVLSAVLDAGADDPFTAARVKSLRARVGSTTSTTTEPPR